MTLADLAAQDRAFWHARAAAARAKLETRLFIGGEFVAQVAEAIEADAGGHAAEELGLGVAVGLGADAAGKLSVVDGEVHQHTFYV